MTTDSDLFDWSPKPRFPPPGWHRFRVAAIEKTTSPKGDACWAWTFRYRDHPVDFKQWTSRSLNPDWGGNPSNALRFFKALAGGRPRTDFASPADFVGREMDGLTQPNAKGWLRITACRPIEGN